MIAALLIALLSAIAQLFLPWWIIAPIAFGICFWKSSTAAKAFAEGTASVTLLWAAYASFLNYQNGGALATRMGELIFKTANSPGLLLTVAPLVGGLVGGLAGLAGYYVRQAIVPTRASMR